MLLPTRHEVVAPGMHRFVFPSESRPGVEHSLLVDLEDDGSGRLSCLCEAALHGRFCKHQRLLVLGLLDTARLEEEGTSRARARGASRRRGATPRGR
jgi:hypothetical protein